MLLAASKSICTCRRIASAPRSFEAGLLQSVKAVLSGTQLQCGVVKMTSESK